MAEGTQGISQSDLARSGGHGKLCNSARAGLLPIGLETAPIRALNGMPVYVRFGQGGDELEQAARAVAALDAELAEEHPGFCLYCAPSVGFSESHRRRLLENGVRFVYIRIADQSRFSRQTEADLRALAGNPAVALAEKSAIIYDTSVELVNELLADPQVMATSPRLVALSKAITTVVMNNPSAFGHLFAVSNHDFYTATHMVNVATWMVPLAFELGVRDPDELDRMCQAGILHDMGKVSVPEAILNKKGTLSDEEWGVLRAHPEAGVRYLAQFPGIHPVVRDVTWEHHERLDGTGYPRGLRGEQIGFASRVCAVVDSFDAMTAFRPFKESTLSVERALTILESEAGTKYDPVVVRAWSKLVRSAPDTRAEAAETVLGPSRLLVMAPDNRRRWPRQAFHCDARGHVLVRASESGAAERPGARMVAHNISRGGVGLLSPTPVRPGEFVRIYLQAPGWEGRGLDAQAVRCREYRDSWHEIGVRFSAVDSAALPHDGAEAA